MIKMMKSSGYELISFEDLCKISDENTGRFNQNVDTPKVLKKHPQLKKGWNMLIRPIMEHHHFLGKRVKTHLRCMITHGLDILTQKSENHGHWLQDISFEQWESLKGISTEKLQRI